MFSLKTIQKKIKLSTTPATKDNDRAKRKRKKEKSPANKKQHQDTVQVKGTTASATVVASVAVKATAETDVNKNKLPCPPQTHNNSTSVKSKRIKIKKKKHQVIKKIKIKKPPERKKMQKKPPCAPSEPVLYANRSNSSRQWQEPGYDSEPGGFSTPTRENGESSSRLGDSDGFWTGRKHQRRSSDSDTKIAMECSSDSEPSLTGRKHCHRSFPSGTKAAMKHSSDSEQSWSGKKHRHKNSHSKKDKNHYRGKTDLEEHQSLVGECLAVTTTERGSVVAALAPGTSLYLQGTVLVCPLLGTAEVLGYVLPQGQSQPLYSLPTSSLLGVVALEGQHLDPTHASLQGLPASWLESLTEKGSSVMLLEVCRHSSPRVDFIFSAGWRFLGECREWQKHWHSIGASVVTRGNCYKNRITKILPEWREAAETIAMTLKCGSVPRVVVCGGKGVGKSTFFKYLANTLLSAKPDTGVICLDFDPGQPELSMPTSLSLTHLTKPLLGPAYSHDLKAVSSQHRHILVGAVSPQFVLAEYTTAVRELCQVAGTWEREAPLLVNTMGWTQGTGLGLMLDVLRLVLPTHVLQIQGRRAKLNYPFPLERATVKAAKGGISIQAGETELHYSLTLLPSVGQPDSAPHMAQPRVLRELRVLAEAGEAAERGCRVTVPWARVALHVCEEQVPKDRILQVFNAQLVALCCVEPGSLHTVHPDLPQLLANSPNIGDVLGWGVVMGIDPLTSQLHLATSLPSQQVTKDVNALIMPRMHLPASFYKLFCIGEGPYLEKGSLEGANRLRVGRRIKPRRPQMKN